MQFMSFHWLSHHIWVMSHSILYMVFLYTIILCLILQNKVGKISIFWGIFNKTIVPFALVEYKMIIANLALLVLLAIHHLRSNMCSEIVNLILYIRWLGRSICKNLASELREIISSSERVRILVARYEQELLQYKNSFISVKQMVTYT